MNLSDRVNQVLEERREISLNYDYGVENSWEKLTAILSENEVKTINYLMGCSKDNVYWISEVFEDISERLQSRKFIECLRGLDQKFSDLNLTYHIDVAEDYIKYDKLTSNTIFELSKEKFDILSKEMKNNNCYTVELDGKQIQSKEQFFQSVKEKFDLSDVSGWDSLTDWMTDLSWIDNNCFKIIIYNYSEFLSEDKNTKELFIEIFQDDILLFWEKEVVDTVVDGKTKSFNVYLID
ncbi:hypothetical protein UAY_03336 [Enterococcus moraviensis ATCC BAA-383]|uniref:Barstar (barnase inhibitor) domain-containing protein n=1 Tax=Enterococcus moraviensis ATCC BAA-383 TaxID=1158609 RepID=R2SL69_9ENTE|nr:barstar family protein [Enterococcus moraviensis]EOH95910.1 hypothetical protein UAY_03336 [Enterococcus moraviensis ATCC BAA-383]EOT66397.1 hypothetical protein I586_02668 [Enterococcus moraviensis ATCC BAA-383]OJG67539.1 hypothetical protein RV09_GL002308 [Enterococcus moraviensis]